MPELRKDPTTDEWVIVATQRAIRPNELAGRQESEQLGGGSDSCPFCPGREERTPSETYAVRPAGEASRCNGPGWKVRVVPNKFPAVSPEAEPAEPDGPLLFERRPGRGYHEVIIDSPDHNLRLGRMARENLRRLLDVYRSRYLAHLRDARICYVLLFRNYRREAGTSLSHPHSQIVALPLVPPAVKQRWKTAHRYRQREGRNLYDAILDAELREGRRVVVESERFVVLVPFAGRAPFETWIVPKHPAASFVSANERDLDDLATVLGTTIHRFEAGLKDPPYNYMIRSGPVGAEHDAYYRWHIRIVPRLTIAAGFELGSGVEINTVRPEEAAHFLREANR